MVSISRSKLDVIYKNTTYVYISIQWISYYRILEIHVLVKFEYPLIGHTKAKQQQSSSLLIFSCFRLVFGMWCCLCQRFRVGVPVGRKVGREAQGRRRWAGTRIERGVLPYLYRITVIPRQIVTLSKLNNIFYLQHIAISLLKEIVH